MNIMILLYKEEAIMVVDMFFDLCKCLSLCSIYVALLPCCNITSEISIVVISPELNKDDITLLVFYDIPSVSMR